MGHILCFPWFGVFCWILFFFFFPCFGDYFLDFAWCCCFVWSFFACLGVSLFGVLGLVDFHEQKNCHPKQKGLGQQLNSLVHLNLKNNIISIEQIFRKPLEKLQQLFRKQSPSTEQTINCKEI